MKRKIIVLLIGLFLVISFMFFDWGSEYIKSFQTNVVKEDSLSEELVMVGDKRGSEMQAVDEEDSEIQTEDEGEIPVCDIVRAMDFTAKESKLNITPEENRIYLEGYLKVLRNEMPAIGEVEVKYYKDLWKAGIEFEELVKEKDTREYPYLYYYDDLDGDGKPEFAIEQGCMFLFKYEKEFDKCKVLDYEEACYFKTVVGAGQIWRHDGLHADVIRDDLLGLDQDGSFQYILRLEKGMNYKNHYFKVGISDFSLHYVEECDEKWSRFATPFFFFFYVSEEEWNEITQPFFEMVENNAVPRKTLKEVFGDLLEENTEE